MSLNARSLVALVCSLFAACATRPALPQPERPLVRTPDAAFRANAPQPSTLSAKRFAAELQTTTLPNGLTLQVATRRDLPYVALNLVTRGTGTIDSSCVPEVLRLTARVVVEGGTVGTEGRVVEPRSVQGRGVRFQVGPDHVSFEIQAQRDVLSAGLKALVTTVRQPAFGGSSGLNVVRLHELDALQRSTSTVDSVLLRLAVAGNYGEAFARRVAPLLLDPVRAATDPEIQRCYRENFVPHHSALSAVGDITLDELRALAEPLLGSWQREDPSVGERAQPVPASKSKGRTIHWVATDDRLQASVLLLQAAPSQLQVGDQLAFELLAEIAAGSSRSRSNTQLRHEQGVTYGVQPEFIRAHNLGMLVISAAFETEAAAKAITDLLAMLQQLQRTPVSPAELAAAKRQLSTRIARLAANNQTYAAYAAQLFAQGTAPDWLSKLPDALNSIGPADLQRVAARYLRPDDIDIAIVGSWTLRDDLSDIGRIKTYRTVFH